MLTGWSGSADYFRFVESDSFSPKDVESVLHGEVVGVVFRGAFGGAGADQILEAFAQSPGTIKRTDTAAGYYLGAYHYLKPTMQYLQESAKLAPLLDGVLDTEGNPWRRFRDGLSEYFAQSEVVVRPAQHDGVSASIGAVRSWDTAEVFSLVPHEDGSQCGYEGQADFEIQQVREYEICAVNLCLANDSGGELQMWNIKPDEQSRRRCDTYVTGGPYPTDELSGIEELRLDPHPGDLYVFNGGHIHAVQPATGRRATVAALLGFCDDRTVITWT